MMQDRTEQQLALEGGVPVRSMPFAPWPVYAPDEIDAVSQVLASGKVNYWTGGMCTRFEAEYAQSIGVEHAISLANGTGTGALCAWRRAG
jgi:dTDP-4-amino-4,6-dideoxygalactose transaminase